MFASESVGIDGKIFENNVLDKILYKLLFLLTQIINVNKQAYCRKCQKRASTRDSIKWILLMFYN